MMKYIFILLTGVLIASCKSNSTSSDDQPTTDKIMPLAVGNYWHYNVVGFNYYGDTNMFKEVIERIARDTLVGTELWYSLSSNGWEFGEYFTNRSDGLHRYLDYFDNLPPITGLWIPHPVTIGVKKTTYENLSQGTSGSIYLKATNVPVTTAAGSFLCHQYVESIVSWQDTSIVNERDTSITEHFFAPGVGRVRTDRYDEDDPYIYETQELIEYKIN